MKTNKILICILGIVVILMSVLLVGYDLDQKRQLKAVSLDKITKFDESNQMIKYKIESIDVAGGLCKINGWAILEGVNSYNIIPTVVLKSDSGDLYKLSTRIVQRRDITAMYNGGSKNYNSHLTSPTSIGLGMTSVKNVYDNCGLASLVRINELSKNKIYKIGIQLKEDNSEYFIWTDKELKL